jgi:hypothetical protein
VGGNSHDLFGGTSLSFALKELGKPRRISAMVADLRVEIRSWAIPEYGGRLTT